MNSLDNLNKMHEEFNLKAQAIVCEFKLLFDRASALANREPAILTDYVRGTHFLSTKQVASATLLRKAGSASVKAQAELLKCEGFRLTHFSAQPQDLVSMSVENEGPQTASDVYQHAAAVHNEDTNTFYSAHLDGRELEVPNRSKTFEYENPWLVIAGRIYATSCQDATELPHTLVWHGDGLRIQDPLPRRLLGPTWTGKSSNQCRFVDIGNMQAKLHVIYNHTHWGAKLRQLAYDGMVDGVNCGRWARSIKLRITEFLRGKSDPCMEKSARKLVFANLDSKATERARAARLLELLKTIDGMYQQRYFAYPEEHWTWHKYDMFVLTNLSYLLGDEFLDTQLTKFGAAIQTRYSQLKKLRKTFKENALKGTISEWLDGDHGIPSWLNQYIPLYRRVSKETGQRYTYLIGLLSQTRGCGTPPAIVILQSKEKFLKTVTVPTVAPTATQERLVRVAIRGLLSKIPNEAFTGLATKARVSVTTSACWETTRREGGTIGHIHELVEDGRNNVTAPVRDLDTGLVVDERRLDQFDSPGEYIFWRCLDVVLRTPKDDLKVAFLTVVKEPGKGRSVTKGRSCLKVVLDTVNKICAEPLKKGIPSSESGMGKSHHGWNFFHELFDEDFKKSIFDIQHLGVTSYATYEEHERLYHELFVSSTDYENATDAMPHWFSAIAGEAWMTKCGIPGILRGIVHETCYKPRRIFFHGTGPLEDFGEPYPDFGEGIRFINLEKGVLMGDPLTKIVLHFTNVVTREIASGLERLDWLSSGFTNPAQMRRS